MEGIVRGLSSRPSLKNPLYLQIYDASYLNLPFNEIIRNWRYGVEELDGRGADFGLEEFWRRELRPIDIGKYARFSATIYPILQIKGEPIIVISKDASKEPRSINLAKIPKDRGIRGMALREEDLNLMEIQISFTSDLDATYLLIVEKGNSLLIDESDVLLLQKTVLEHLGYVAPTFKPILLSDPQNQILHELYKIIIVLDETNQLENAQVAGNLEHVSIILVLLSVS